MSLLSRSESVVSSVVLMLEIAAGVGCEEVASGCVRPISSSFQVVWPCTNLTMGMEKYHSLRT